MKLSILALTSILAYTTTGFSEPRKTLDKEKAEAIALIQVQNLNKNEDVLAIVREGLKPSYSIVSVDHVIGLDYYQVLVRRTSILEECPQTQSVVIDNSDGELIANAPIQCEGN